MGCFHRTGKRRKRLVFSAASLILLALAACSTPPPSHPDVPAPQLTAFSLEVNDRVLAGVRNYTRTSASKKEFQAALVRMKRDNPKMAPIFEKDLLPPELLFLPLVLTNYTNLRSTDYESGLGLWKFTPYTATTYGLINGKKDNRLLIAQETDAAGTFLKHLFDLFHDWRFVLISYCEGEGWLTATLEKHPSSTAWEIDATLPEGQSCLAQTMAALYLAQHPDLLN